MDNITSIWAIFVADNSNRFPNFFPIGIYLTEEKAKEKLQKLPQDNNYQLLKLPVDKFFGYFNKNNELVGMDGIPHWHYHYKEELEE